MTLSPSRVASRWLQAAVLSPKWFKDQQDALKAILKRPTKRATDWWWDLRDQAEPWWDSFGTKFQQVVAQPEALRSIADRVKSAEGYLAGLRGSLERFGSTGHVDFNDPESYLKWYAKTSIHTAAEAKVTTIGDLFRWEHGVNQPGLDRLVSQTIKQASPEELASLTNDSLYRTKYEFLARVGFEKKALKLYKRSKLEWDPLKWLPRLQEMLQANYSEQGIQEAERFREFDLYGMKVVVDDTTVEPSGIQKYVGYFDQAYKAMKQKGFGSAWYGVLFIQCEECGGTNYNTNTPGGVGGHYVIGKDTVSVFSRPSTYTTYIVVHELGHRYWFKQMSGEQRARFTDLVKTHTVMNPGVVAPHLLDSREQLRALGTLAGKGKGLFKAWAQTVDSPDFTEAERWDATDDLKVWCDSVKLAVEFAGATKNDIGPELVALNRKLWDKASKLQDLVMAGAVREVRSGLDRLVELAREVLKTGDRLWNEKQLEGLEPKGKEWWETYERNPAPILPVSNYGRSNPDEAFAEVFTHYCLDRDMDRDQLESFKSVLKTAGIQPLVQEVSEGVPSGISQGGHHGFGTPWIS